MYRFYFDDDNMYDNEILIKGSDVNHIRNVLRMKCGDRVIANDTNGTDYYCIIKNVDTDSVLLEIEHQRPCEAELKTKLYLFQALPKSDKMEFIIQKAVELGVYEIIPVATERCVVKLDGGAKQERKLSRWQTIAEAAAKQSARGIIPKVNKLMKFNEALDYAKNLGYNLIPFEHAEGMDEARKCMDVAADAESVGIFIGPEGGFEDSEIEKAIDAGLQVISLGNRILRTETAGLAVLSILMFKISE